MESHSGLIWLETAQQLHTYFASITVFLFIHIYIIFFVNWRLFIELNRLPLEQISNAFMINSNIVQVGLCLVDKYVDNLFFNAFPLSQTKR